MLPWFCKTTLFTSESVDTMMGVPNMFVLNTSPYLQITKPKTKNSAFLHFLFIYGKGMVISFRFHWGGIGKPEAETVVTVFTSNGTHLQCLRSSFLLQPSQKVCTFFVFSSTFLDQSCNQRLPRWKLLQKMVFWSL